MITLCLAVALVPLLLFLVKWAGQDLRRLGAVSGMAQGATTVIVAISVLEICGVLP